MARGYGASVTDASESGSRRFATGSMARVGAARLLRLRADERLASMLEPAKVSGEGGFIKVPSRESVGVGDLVRVEVSFGAMADEIVLRGFVDAIVEREGRAPVIAIRVAPEHAARLRYVDEVVSKGRAATARTARRIPSEIPATWYWGLGSHATRIGDLSRGGAFIRSAAPPPAGSRIRVHFDDAKTHPTNQPEPTRRGGLELEAIVAWTGSSSGTRGFGVKFRIVDREQAERIAALVRWHEQQAGLID